MQFLLRFITVILVVAVAAAAVLSKTGVPGWAPAEVRPVVKVVGKNLDWLVAKISKKIANKMGKTQETQENPTTPAPVAAPDTQKSDAVATAVTHSEMRINDAGLEIIKQSEGLRLEAYESGGQLYIGYGHQMAPGEPKNITEARATQLLRADVKIAEEAVLRLVTRPMNENQFSAMVGLTYNIGSGAFAKSSILTKFNAGDIDGAANAFLLYNKAGGKVLPHLTHRREQERALFLTPAE